MGAALAKVVLPSKTTILFVDTLKKLAAKILEKYGHTAEIAENGSLAVNLYKVQLRQGKPFDITLMDASIPLVCDIEATVLIGSFEIHKGISLISIIALTVHAMIGDRERCL